MGISAGIAAYKSVELARLMVKNGYDVQVAMTPASTRLLSPLTLQSLTGKPVAIDLFDAEYHEGKVKHVDLASFPDIVVVAPATANTLAKLATGMADNLLTTLLLATSADVVLAPSMNENMFYHPAVQNNLNVLCKRNYYLLEPKEGGLACNAEGKGRMPSPEEIYAYINNLTNEKRDFEGVKALVTAGPTREFLDPVRYLSNRSTGRMGYAIANTFLKRGADVTLISGPTDIKPPTGVKVIRIETAQEMFQCVKEEFKGVDVVVKAAAVADYAPVSEERHKIKKDGNEKKLELKRTPDILKWLGEHKNEQVLVGFAAETRDLEVNALNKIHSKNLDLMVANDLTEKGAGFAGDTNKVKIMSPVKESVELPLLTKEEVSNRILDEIYTLMKS